MKTRWQDRITIDPDIHHGDPCIKGTRIPVSVLLDCLADGMNPDQILQEYPQLTEADIHVAIGYAAEVLRQEVLLPLSS